MEQTNFSTDAVSFLRIGIARGGIASTGAYIILTLLRCFGEFDLVFRGPPKVITYLPKVITYPQKIETSLQNIIIYSFLITRIAP